jgi:hypothetical protein
MTRLQERVVILELDMVTNKYSFIRTLQSAHIRTNAQVNRFVPMVIHLFWQYRKRLRLGPDTWRNLSNYMAGPGQEFLHDTRCLNPFLPNTG